MAIAAQHKPLPDIAEQWGWNGMSVIAVVSKAAGVGKTAFAAHIAIQAGRAGAGPAAMLDVSPSRALADWKQRRGKPLPEVRASDLGQVGDDIGRLRQERLFPLCILDLMASDAAGARQALAMAQLAVILSPAQSGALDEATVLAEDIAAMGVPVAIVPAGMPPGQDFWDARTFALRRRGLLVPAAFHRDDAVARAMSEGRTANETDPEGAAANDIARLWPLLRGVLVAPPAGQATRPGTRRNRSTVTIAVAGPPGPMRAGVAAHLAVTGGMGDDGAISAVLVSSVADGPLAQWVAKREGRPPPLRIAIPGAAGSLREWAGELGAGLCVIEIAPDELRDDAELRETIDQVVVPVLAPQAAGLKLPEQAFWPHRPVFVLLRGGESPAEIVKAKRALAQKGGGLAGTLKLGAELAKSFGEGGTIIEDRPNSRTARDIVELWATLRTLRMSS